MKLFLFLGMLFLSTAVAACPFCNSKTATQIRSSLFGRDFLFNLSVSLLPFVIFYLITYLIYNGGWKRAPKKLNQ
jgi:hypothetical protein